MTININNDKLTGLHKLSLSREQPLMKKARRLGAYMDRMYREGEKRGDQCGQLLLDWGKECFWGRMVGRHLPYFSQLWKWLDDREHHSHKTAISLVDVDYSVWIEKPSNEDRRVIISICHCRMFDDNTTIFIEDGLSGLFKFRVVTVWPKEKKSRCGHKYGDMRDIDLPALSTYRKKDWNWGYEDFRDKGHVLVYDSMSKRVEGACYTEVRMSAVLDELKWLVSETQETGR